MRTWPGAVAAGVLLAVTLGTLIVVLLWADPGKGLGPGDWAALRFTILQAVLSAIFSVVPAIFVARALARRRFPGRKLLITLLGAPFILPVIVAILGLLAVFGRSGIVSQILGLLGLPPLQIYGLHGVVLAHVFFNLPLATRLLLQGWMTVPAEQFRLAASLDFRPSAVFRQIEWPMLREVVPGALVVIFLICLTSFAVALALGGGPGATTVELAIYQAFRFDVDLTRAAILSLLQVAICAVAAIGAFFVALPRSLNMGHDRAVERWDARHLWPLDAAVILGGALFLLTPLAMLVIRGAPGLLSLPASVWPAAGISVSVALASTLLTLLLALPLALWIARAGRWGWAIEGIAALSLATSPLVMGTGLFLVTYRFAAPQDVALAVTVLVNAVVSVPFAVRILVPPVREIADRFDPLSESLGMVGGARVRLVVLPRLRRPLGFAAGLSAALSMGDLGVIALFADPSRGTLPLHVYRLMTAYQMEAAAGAALLLLGLSLAAFWLCDRGGRVDADA